MRRAPILIPNDGTSRAPRLAVYQSMWGMDEALRGKKAWSREEAFAKIAEAGFDGADLVVMKPNDLQALAELADRHKLRIGISCYPTRVPDLETPLKGFVALHGDYVAAQVFPYPVKTGDAVASLRKLFAHTRDAGVPLFVETHRGRVTQDLLQTAELCDSIPELALCANLAEYVVAHELGWGIPKDLQRAFDAIGARAGMIHGRVSDGERAHIDIGRDAKNPHAAKFANYWKKIMVGWLRQAKPGDLFVFRAELGPADAAVVDSDRLEPSDRWEQAKATKMLAIRTWNAAVEEAGVGEAHAP
jgi:sugar phosphate isomerase/epimerase